MGGWGGEGFFICLNEFDCSHNVQKEDEHVGHNYRQEKSGGCNGTGRGMKQIFL